MLTSRPSHDIRMLALATVAALVLCAPAVVIAQSSAPAPTAAKSTAVAKRHAKGGAAEEQSEMNEHLQKMSQRLKLSDDQLAKVREMMQSKMVEVSELHAKYKGQASTAENKAAMEKAHKELRAIFEAKLAEVLNADQMTEYKKMRAEHMKKESAKEEKEEEAKEPKK